MHYNTNRALKECEQSQYQKGTSPPMRQAMMLTGRILIKTWREITSASAQEWSRNKAESQSNCQTAWSLPLCPKLCKTYSFFKFIWESKWDIGNAKSSAEENSKYILASFKKKCQKHFILQQAARCCEKWKDMSSPGGWIHLGLNFIWLKVPSLQWELHIWNKAQLFDSWREIKYLLKFKEITVSWVLLDV